MSDYFDFPPNDYDEEGDDNPFAGLPGYDDTFSDFDPFERAEREVLDTFGISSFDDIFVTRDEATLEGLRGNRFDSFEDAIWYLFDSGVLRFSGIVIDDDDEIAVDIDAESN